jgi:hypothetical protein
MPTRQFLDRRRLQMPRRKSRNRSPSPNSPRKSRRRPRRRASRSERSRRPRSSSRPLRNRLGHRRRRIQRNRPLSRRSRSGRRRRNRRRNRLNRSGLIHSRRPRRPNKLPPRPIGDYRLTPGGGLCRADFKRNSVEIFAAKPPSVDTAHRRPLVRALRPCPLRHVLHASS